jgi:hypothetical protein
VKAELFGTDFVAAVSSLISISIGESSFSTHLGRRPQSGGHKNVCEDSVNHSLWQLLSWDLVLFWTEAS